MMGIDTAGIHLYQIAASLAAFLPRGIVTGRAQQLHGHYNMSIMI